MLVEFDMLLEPQTSKKTGKTYHYVSVRVEGRGTGQVYLTSEQHQALKVANLKRGDLLEIVPELSLWNGKFELFMSDFRKVA